MEETYEQKVEKYKTAWDNFSQVYYNSLNRNSLCLMSILMALTRVSKKAKIIDAGCGPGLGTKMLMAEVPQFNSLVYAFDFSSEMIKFSKEVFTNHLDFNFNKNNHWEVMNDYGKDGKLINIEEDSKGIRSQKIGKILKLFEGNAENLLFEDSQFDVYLSSLCLMLCLDVDKAISESYRVLNSDGVAAFAIWGKRSESKLILDLFSEVLLKYEVDITKDKTSFWLAEDVEGLKEKFLKAGFKEVRVEYTWEIYDTYDEEDFLTKFCGPMIKKALTQVKDQSLVPQIMEEIKTIARKKIVEEKVQPTLSTLILIAFK